MKRRRKRDGPTGTPTPKGGFRQSDEAIIPEEALSFREAKVLAALRATSAPLTVKQLARKCFPGMRSKELTYETKKADGTKVRHGTAASYRCVLNCLRRLVAGRFAEKIERGTYAAVMSPPEKETTP